MKPFLLDVNVLIALTWPSHLHHRQAQAWFGLRRTAGFRTCPLTQTGLVRISCNRSFTPEAVSPRDALALLETITSLPEHQFWPDDLPLNQAIGREQQIAGHRQITDIYLLALAKSRGGILATFDRAVLSLPCDTQESVELVQAS